MFSPDLAPIKAYGLDYRSDGTVYEIRTPTQCASVQLVIDGDEMMYFATVFFNTSKHAHPDLPSKWGDEFYVVFIGEEIADFLTELTSAVEYLHWAAEGMWEILNEVPKKTRRRRRTRAEINRANFVLYD